MFPKDKKILCVFLFAPLLAFAQERIRIDIKTNKDCLYSEIVKVERLEVRKSSRILWDGKCKGGYLDGKGNLTLHDIEGGIDYVSVNYINGMENGEGTAYYESQKIKIKFRGSWVNGSRTKGILEVTYPTGVSFIYEGPFNDGKFTGDGKIEYADGRKYQGFFNENKLIKGRVIYKSGAVYEGEFANLKPHGAGVMTFANGTKINAEFTDGKTVGVSNVKYSDGRIYDGIFDIEAGLPNGYGKMVLAAGGVLEGIFSRGVIVGKGILKFANGDIYEGEFINNKRSGEGVYTWKSGTSYKGIFLDGIIIGSGYYVMSSGDVHEGQHNSGKKFGIWKIRRANGEIWYQEYADGEKVSETPDVNNKKSSTVYNSTNQNQSNISANDNEYAQAKKRQKGIDSLTCEAYSRNSTADQKPVAPPGRAGLESFLSIFSQATLINMNTQEAYDSCMKRLGY
jgi:hypothetical protein